MSERYDYADKDPSQWTELQIANFILISIGVAVFVAISATVFASFLW